MSIKRIYYAAAALVTGVGGYFFSTYQQNPQLLPHPLFADAVHLPTLHAVFQQADAYKYAHNYTAAKTEFEKILPTLTNPDEQLYAHNQLTFIALEMNDDSLAGRYLQQIAPQISAKTPPSVKTDFFYNKGVWAYRCFRPKEAEYCLHQSLAAAEAARYAENHLKIARIFATLGAMHYEFAHTPDSSFKYLPKAEKIFESNKTLEAWSGECLWGMAMMTNSRRQYKESGERLEKAIQILERQPYLDSVLLARVWSIKARVIQVRRDTALEDEDLRLKLNKKVEDCFNKSRQYCPLSHFRLQECYREEIRYFARYAREETFHYKAHFWEKLAALQAVIRQQKIDRLGVPDRLLGIYYANKLTLNPDSSLFFTKKFVQTYEQDTSAQRNLLADGYAVLAVGYIGLADKNQGTFWLDSALQCYKMNLLRYANAKNLNQSWGDILKPQFYRQSSFQYISFTRAAQMFYKKHQMRPDFRQLDTALRITRLTDQILMSGINTHDDEAHEFVNSESAEVTYNIGINAAHIFYKKTGKTAFLDLAFLFGERVRSFLLFRDAIFQDSIHKSGAKVPPQYWLQTLNRQSAEVYELSVEHDKNDGTNTDLTQKLGVAQRRLDTLFAQIQREYPDYYRLKIVQPIPKLREVQKRLSPNQWFVQYTLSDSTLFAFFLGREAVHLEKIKWSKSWDKTLNVFFKQVSGDTSNLTAAQFSRTSTALFSQLFPKNLPPQYRNCRELIICPDRELNLIPFEALTTDSSLQSPSFHTLPYLIHSFPITYAPSWKIYDTYKDVQLSPKPSLHGYTYGFETKQFKSAKQEFAFLDTLFKNRDHYSIGSDCSSQRFINDSKDTSDILHLSLHAQSTPLSKNDDKIYFGANFTDSLLGYKLLDRRFNAKLVVLSACRSAFGTIKKGEGAYALSRIFQRLGVPRVVASIWSIPEKSTLSITSSFYSYLLHHPPAPNSTAVALRQAKLQYFTDNKTNHTFCHPKYWAGLVCLD